MNRFLLAAVSVFTLLVCASNAHAFGYGFRQRVVVRQQVVVQKVIAQPVVVQKFVAPIYAQPVVTQAFVAPVYAAPIVAPVYSPAIIQQRQVISGGCQAFFAY